MLDRNIEDNNRESLEKCEEDTRITEGYYEQLMELNYLSFEKGLYETSYHSLVAAMYTAKELKADKYLRMIIERANEQKYWFDNYAPEHPLSSVSAALQGDESMYTQLAEKAAVECCKLAWDRRFLNRTEH